MGKKHKTEWCSSYEEYADKPLEKPLKPVLKVGGSEVTELSGSGHNSRYYDDRPDTVYYKLSKKILHAGFKMMSKQAALLGSEETAVEEPVTEVVSVQVETAKKSKRPSREVISCMFDACFQKEMIAA
ncbi:Bromodomain-containing protein 9 [Myotis davidii]|uniref:Bromodomain-containing protein 9 n=1 Tax=Myotis davidii TaxID=225400 RepID=L5LD35_MYODS|nr:Bromodomain-containing protein 9 [Myotis davidii]